MSVEAPTVIRDGEIARKMNERIGAKGLTAAYLIVTQKQVSTPR